MAEFEKLINIDLKIQNQKEYISMVDGFKLYLFEALYAIQQFYGLHKFHQLNNFKIDFSSLIQIISYILNIIYTFFSHLFKIL